MKKWSLLLFIAANSCAYAQPQKLVKVDEVRRIETILAADSLRGRRAGTPDIDRAAAFIAAEFKKAGLQPLNGKSYLQEFTMVRPTLTSLKYEASGVALDADKIVVVTCLPELKLDEHSGYAVERIGRGDNLLRRAQALVRDGRNTIVYVDTSFAKNFSRLNGLKRQLFNTTFSTIFILSQDQPSEFKLKAEHVIEPTRYANVAGMIPGKSRKNELVVFSGHYDHLGIARQPVNGDSIFNGANDDAAGTTAVILLADYFKKKGGNERTLIFVAFTAEESGGFGSQYFSRQFDPTSVVAMFNIEMIGTESKWGPNSAYITGFDQSDMGAILQKNLEGTGFHFYPDPYPSQNLFFRSDNATLARLGVPAHTISTSKMDTEPNYHKVSDEVSTLDMDNMAAIISAIAQSAGTIISGKDTPARIQMDTPR